MHSNYFYQILSIQLQLYFDEHVHVWGYFQYKIDNILGDILIFILTI